HTRACMDAKKNAKTKARSSAKRPSAPKDRRQDILHQKPALRSEAFVRALTAAKSSVVDNESLQTLFGEAARKAAAVPREPFRESWAYLQTMLRLIRAYHRGEYDQVPD